MVYVVTDSGSSMYEMNIWRNKQDKYLPVRIFESGQFLYGWVRLDVATNTATIKDFAVELSPGATITAGDGQPAPVTQLFSDGIGPTEAVLNWNSPIGVHHFRVRVKQLGGNNWVNLTAMPGNILSKSLTGLQNNVSYQWQVNTYYDAAEMFQGGWSAVDTFITGCYPPDSNWVDPIISNGARLNWTEQAGAAYYQISGRRVGATQWTSLFIPAGTSQKDVFGLTAGTAYEWTIRTLCDTNWVNVSPWALLQTFTTALFANPGEARLEGEDSFEPIPENCISIFPNPVAERAVIQLQTSKKDPQPTEIRLINIKGIVVREMLVTEDEFVFERGDLKPGFYFIECCIDGIIIHEKVVIQ